MKQRNREAAKKFSVQPFSKGCDLKKRAAHGKKQAPCHTSSQSCEQGTGRQRTREIPRRSLRTLRGDFRKAWWQPPAVEDGVKKPPTGVSYEKQSTGLFFYFPAFAEGD